jgi:hypothetical protein
MTETYHVDGRYDVEVFLVFESVDVQPGGIENLEDDYVTSAFSRGPI